MTQESQYKDLEVLDQDATIQIKKPDKEEINSPILKPLNKMWCIDIIRSIIPSNIDSYQSGNNITIKCGTDKKAAEIENLIVSQWFKAVEIYLTTIELQPSHYQKSFMFTCSITNGDLSISF